MHYKNVYKKDIKKVHGPYTRKDDRQHVVLVFTDLSKQTVSYPKFLMEQHIGRELDPNIETIDHIDGNFSNNNFDNLRIIERSEHAKQDAIYVEKVEIICPLCGNTALKRAKDLAHNKKNGKAGPFCGRSCAGKYSSYVQNGCMEKIGNSYEDIRKYYKITKR